MAIHSSILVWKRTWWATVDRVAKIPTPLGARARTHTHTHTHRNNMHVELDASIKTLAENVLISRL